MLWSNLAGKFLLKAERHVQTRSIVWYWSEFGIQLTRTGITSLKPPPFESSLQFLTIGRGTITYSCDNRSDTQTPIYTTQDTFLYDASPLIPKFSSENQFHSYIPRFLEYDYTSLDNSSLTCIGNVQRVKDYNIFTIYNVDAFPVKVKETVHSPDDPQFDLDWLHVSDYSQEWDVYRVETAGGGPPYNCGDQIISDTIPVEYVAEYWFYRKSQSDSKALKRT